MMKRYLCTTLLATTFLSILIGTAIAGFIEIPNSEKIAHIQFDGRDELQPKLILSPCNYNTGSWNNGSTEITAICRKGGKITLVVVAGWKSGMRFEIADSIERAYLLGPRFPKERPNLAIGVPDVESLNNVASTLDETEAIEIVRAYDGVYLDKGFSAHFVFSTDIVEFKQLLENTFSIWIKMPVSGYEFDPPIKAIFDTLVPVETGRELKQSQLFIKACVGLI